MWKTDSVRILICAAFIILSGCDSSDTDVVKKINSIKIVDIQPAVSEPLKPGQKIDIEVKLTYELKSKAATVTLAVLRTEGFGSKLLASTFTIIHQGKGELLLKTEFIVPEAEEKVLQVRAHLMPQQRDDSAPVARREYKIAQ